MKKIIRIVLAIMLVHGIVVAQEKVLDKKVNLIYREITMREALGDIAYKYGINISYSSTTVPINKKISVIVKDEPLRVALEKLLEGTGATFVEVGNQVVLKKAPVSQKPSSAVKQTDPKTAVLTPVHTTAVVVKEEVTKTTFFKPEELPVVEHKENLDKVYLTQQNKIYEEYFAAQDSVVKPETGKALKQELKTALKLLKEEVQKLSDSLNLEKITPKPLRKDYVKEEQVKEELARVEQIEPQDSSTTVENPITEDESDDLKTRPVQISFIYPLGTNGVESPSFNNNFSFNLLAGFNGGVEGAEISALLNVVKEDVKGGQVAGFGNIVGDEVRGVQVAGFGNIASGTVKGGQFAGFMNMTGDTSDVFQAAGFMNIVSGANFGGQFAGFMNITSGSMVGPQGAGFMNLSGGNVKGLQAAGFMNMTEKTHDGVQVAGFMNIAESVRGAQFGVLNLSGKVKGSQVGVFNFADTVSGTQIGILSFSRKGYFHVEISGTETLYPTLSLKTGGNSNFYNILNFGVEPINNESWWYGYGIGSQINLTEKVPMNIDLIANYVTKTGERSHEYFNMVNQLKLTFGYSFGKHFTVFAGPVLNVQISSMPEYDFESYSLAPYTLIKKTYLNLNERRPYPTFLTAWTGFTAGIRI